MRTQHARALILAALAGAAGLSSAESALASNPLEYPDNGSAAFSRGGAWLGVANEPIATHYNPAALATQASGFSIEQQLNFPKTCYYRRGPNDSYTGPDLNPQNSVTLPDGSTLPRLIYVPVCNSRTSFPNTIPSISVAWRVTDKLGVGVAIVPPATYGTSDQSFPLMAKGYDLKTHQYRDIPAPWRYQQLDQLSTILFPTVGIGYELFKNFRIGAAFVSGIAVINTSTVGVAQLVPYDAAGDHAPTDDSVSTLRTKDLFVPGVILSLHWSVMPQLDVALWGRYMDAIKSSDGELVASTETFGLDNRPQPVCRDITNSTTCTGATSPNYFNHAVSSFKYPLPPEVRVGVRFHQPRDKSRMLFGVSGPVRDPLHDDLFDVELDGSYTMNSQADTIEIRFPSTTSGRILGTLRTSPTGVSIPPNADRWTGYEDSYGVRLGGQWNAIQDKFAIRAGGWLETRSQDPAWMTVAPIGAMRWGFGGGIVFRQDFIDISFGYQRHESAGLDNHGNGLMRAVVGTAPTFDAALDNGKAAKDRTQFRTEHTVNGGHLTFSADVFTLGGTVRF